MTTLSQLSLFEQSPFDRIRRTDENGEYWLARELMPFLEYTDWRNFQRAIKDAKVSCKTRGGKPLDHFVGVNTHLATKQGAQRKITDFKLSRYACYLIAMNGDTSKAAIANAQSYFLEQTRRQEIADTQARLSPRNRELALLEKSGYGDHPAVSKLRTRVTGIDTFKALKDAIASKCNNPRYGEIVNAEYLGLFNATATALKLILNTKSVRDALPNMQLSALAFAEAALREVLSRADTLTSEEICRIAYKICFPLGNQLRDISETLGINAITGQSLLAASFSQPEQKLLGEGR